MSTPLEDYALIGDCQTAGLVSRDGSLDWLCLPRFDSGACFAALLGGPEHGRFRLGPVGPTSASRRRYRGDTLVLETEHSMASGRAAVIDFMPIRDRTADVVRIVEGRAGVVPMELELTIRFDYGSTVPWVRRQEGALLAVAGPDCLLLRAPVPLENRAFATRARFEVKAGQRLAFDLSWFPSHTEAPRELDAARTLDETEGWWRSWSDRGTTREGPWSAPVRRSLITLKALTYAPTGGIVAAPTTSLPERLGGVRNWDYRFCWLRDATFTLYALVEAGYLDEARAFREWLLRGAAGKPEQLQLMYGLHGERRMPELELGWLPGYESSRPVRTGNDAHTQVQHDMFGELLDTLHACWKAGLSPAPDAWRLERALIEYLEQVWSAPDDGIWEVRGPRRDFTHSRMMAWVALDRAIKGIERFGLEGPIERWRALRQTIHREVCQRGFHPERGAFVQSFGSRALDASLLMMPMVGFLPASDPRVRATIEAIERELTEDGFVRRYRPSQELDGLPPGEGTFLLCSFWLADCLELLGRHDDAVAMFERLLAVRNDVGLLAEGYDPGARRLLGNFPQAFSHVGLVNTARNLTGRQGPAQHRPAD